MRRTLRWWKSGSGWGRRCFRTMGFSSWRIAHKEKVKFTFAHGAQLADGNGLFNAGLGGKKWPAIDLFEGDELDGAAFKELVREVVVYNKRR